MATSTVALKRIAVLVKSVVSDFNLASGHLYQFVLHATAEQNVNTTSSHVSRNRNRALSARFCNNDRFLLVELCVQNVVRNAVHQRFKQKFSVALFEAPLFQTPIGPSTIDDRSRQSNFAQQGLDFRHVQRLKISFKEPSCVLGVVAFQLFGLLNHRLKPSHDNQFLEHVRLDSLRHVFSHFDRPGADQSRLLLAIEPNDLPSDRSKLGFKCFVDNVALVRSTTRTVGWDADNVKAVNLSEFVLFRLRRSRHASQLLIKSEKVLERDCRNGLALSLNRYAFFRFQGLV